MNRTVLVVAIAVLVGRPLSGAEPAVTPQLEPDPAVAKALASLGAGESAALPKVKTTGDINAVAKRYNMHVRGPGARDYCIKMAWMPDRKRAVFYGANHGSPHRLNDVWEYDLPANTWVCLYGPDSLRGKGDWAKNLDRDSLKTGIPRTKRGGPAIIPHSWWQLAYDPELKAMLTFCSWSMVPAEVRDAQRKGSHRPPFWAFYPEKKQWEPITGSTFKGKRPRYHNASALEYIPQLGATVWCANGWANRGMWTYHSKSNVWTNLRPNGGNMKTFQANAPGAEQVMAYAPDRGLLVGHRAGQNRQKVFSGATDHYSVEQNAWKRVMRRHGDECWGKDKDDKKPGMPPGHDAGTNFAYDRVARVFLLLDGRSVWAYDPDRIEWTKLSPKGPPPPGGRDGKLAYYDVAQNVFVVPGKWVYRHKK